jgi:hypothetical protein
MGRPRLYDNDAERQRAFRERRAELIERVKKSNLVPKKPSRPLARPARLQRAINELAELASEYEAWLENVPEHLGDSAQAEKATAAVDCLHEVLDTLAGIDVPKGYGRD